MKKIIILILLLFPSLSFADKWDKTDTSLQVAYSLVHLVDWSQTIEIAKSDTYCESNLFLGKRPSRDKINKYFGGALIGHYLISKWLKKPYRNIWQSVTIGLELGYIHHNIKNGFKVRFDF